MKEVSSEVWTDETDFNISINNKQKLGCLGKVSSHSSGTATSEETTASTCSGFGARIDDNDNDNDEMNEPHRLDDARWTSPMVASAPAHQYNHHYQYPPHPPQHQQRHLLHTHANQQPCRDPANAAERSYVKVRNNRQKRDSLPPMSMLLVAPSASQHQQRWDSDESAHSIRRNSASHNSSDFEDDLGSSFSSWDRFSAGSSSHDRFDIANTSSHARNSSSLPRPRERPPLAQDDRIPTMPKRNDDEEEKVDKENDEVTEEFELLAAPTANKMRRDDSSVDESSFASFSSSSFSAVSTSSDSSADTPPTMPQRAPEEDLGLSHLIQRALGLSEQRTSVDTIPVPPARRGEVERQHPRRSSSSPLLPRRKQPRPCRRNSSGSLRPAQHLHPPTVSISGPVKMPGRRRRKEERRGSMSDSLHSILEED